MHPLYEKADKLSSEVIGAAIEVHRGKGPGLIESIYERCMLRELELRSIPATIQKLVRVEYKGLVFDEPLRFDILVDDYLLVELKALEILHPSSKAQLFSYMKLLGIPIGLLINFHEPVLKRERRLLEVRQNRTFVRFVIFYKRFRIFCITSGRIWDSTWVNGFRPTQQPFICKRFPFPTPGFSTFVPCSLPAFVAWAFY